MAEITFDDDILPIIGKYREQMIHQSISTSQGVFSLDLQNYESVKRLNKEISVAIHGHNPKTKSAHPMPPGPPENALSDGKLATWDTWVAQGMLEKKSPLV